MSVFLQTDLDNEWAFVRGAARLMIAPEDDVFPTEISDIVDLASGASQYDAAGNWTDLGATKTGIQVSINHAEETFDVDQILADIESVPVNWECSVQTALAEMTLEHLQVAWEGGEITTNAATTSGVDERAMGYGQPTKYTRRVLAVLYKSDVDLIRAFVFRRVQLMPIESQVTFNKTGEQISIPVQFKALADTSIDTLNERFFVTYEQISGA
jgi:hypothetical protein